MTPRGLSRPPQDRDLRLGLSHSSAGILFGLSLGPSQMQWWWMIAVAAYMLAGALLSRKIAQPSSFLDKILITLIWMLFWPFMLLIVEFLWKIWPEQR
jgi:hypothetical protein